MVNLNACMDCTNAGAVVRVVNSTGSAASLFTVTEGDANTVLTLCAQLVYGGGVAPGSSGLEREVPLLLTTTGTTAGSVAHSDI